MPALQRTSVMFAEMAACPGLVELTEMRTKPVELAPAPFASGVPTVKKLELCVGGLQEGNASGGPCVRFGEPHGLYEGTSDTRSGVAPAGRG